MLCGCCGLPRLARTLLAAQTLLGVRCDGVQAWPGVGAVPFEVHFVSLVCLPAGWFFSLPQVLSLWMQSLLVMIPAKEKQFN